MKESLKETISNIKFLLVVLGVPYLIFAYTNLTFNPLMFGGFSRFLFGIWSLGWGVFAVKNWGK